MDYYGHMIYRQTDDWEEGQMLAADDEYWRLVADLEADELALTPEERAKLVEIEADLAAWDELSARGLR